MRLKMIVNHLGPKNWTVISSFMPGRTAKQCRDRYSNYLAPGIINSKWTDEEDALLYQIYNKLGNCWSNIQKFFPLRSANSIKNRYKYAISKKMGIKNKPKVKVVDNLDNDIFEDNDFDSFFEEEDTEKGDFCIFL